MGGGRKEASLLEVTRLEREGVGPQTQTFPWTPDSDLSLDPHPHILKHLDG